MTPMPVNPIVVLQFDANGRIVNERNNIGNDLKIVVVAPNADFNGEAAGVPYSGINPPTQAPQVLAMRKK